MDTNTEGTRWDALYAVLAVALMYALCPLYPWGGLL